jgi:hypothetical protein
MPADSDLELPQTFRPIGVRLAIYVLGAVLAVASFGIWFAFPPEIRAQFTAFELLTLLALGLTFYAAGWALSRSRVVARDTGLTVVNGFRTRRFEWNQVLAVTLRNGSPWAMLDLSDGTTVAAMGIQGSDGGRAQRQVRRLRVLVQRHTR